MNHSMLQARGNMPLTHDALRARVPSIFAQAPFHDVSDRYAFIPTIDVLDAMGREGWFPVKAQEQRVRIEGRRGFTRHVVRLRRSVQDLVAVGDTVTEIVLLNSHDRTSAYQIHAGIFRLACLNGLVVADSTFNKISIRHSGGVIKRVIDATAQVVKDVPRITDGIERMRAVNLDEPERAAFAESAIMLRDSALPLEASHVLQPRRYADNKPDLWTTYNVVQENLIRGGLRSRTATGRRTHTRAISSIQEDTRLNKALWSLAEKMATLKAA